MAADLRERALRLLAQRDHTRAELLRKLAAHANAVEIESLASQLEQAGLLSDARFAESFVAARGGRTGSLKLRHELKNRGVDADLIEAYAARDAESEFEHARAIWLRKFGSPPSNARDYARQARFLAGRGFAAEIVRRVLSEPLEGRL